MRSLDQITKVMEKLYERKVVAYIAAPRYCPECAKEGWEGEKLDQTVYINVGMCKKCKKVGMVGYIEGKD